MDFENVAVAKVLRVSKIKNVIFVKEKHVPVYEQEASGEASKWTVGDSRKSC